jgi:GT2 family glycosyltransferase
MDRVPIVVVIPTRYDIDMLENLLPSMKDADEIIVLDNGLSKEKYTKLMQSDARRMGNFWILPTEGLSIYQMWNLGWAMYPNTHLAILNDDIYFLPGTLAELSRALIDNPEIAAICPDYNRPTEAGMSPAIVVMPTTSTYGNGGLAGFAFMLNTSLPIPKIDEKFQWWYGDDDLVYNIERAGYKVAKLLGVPVAHAQGLSSRQDSTIPHDSKGHV